MINRFINLSNRNFSEQEQTVLNKGFKPNIQPSNNLKLLGIGTEIALIDEQVLFRMLFLAKPSLFFIIYTVCVLPM